MRHLLIAGALLFGVLGCGYTTGSLLPSNYRIIAIEPFKNNVGFVTDNTRRLYVPLLESKVRSALIDRFNFDGHLRVKESQKADLILKGELTGFDRDELRLSDNQDVQEYRIRITVSLTLMDPTSPEPVWVEPSFSGETTYFVSGPQAKSESDALTAALTDLSRRIVERTIENW